jgi:hypothetical protein
MTKNKISIYLSKEIHRQILEEMERQDRTMSWLLKIAWELSKERFAKLHERKQGEKQKHGKGGGFKMSLYVHEYAEIHKEAKRLKQGVSWILSRSWMLAYKKIKSVADLPWKPCQTPMP